MSRRLFSLVLVISMLVLLVACAPATPATSQPEATQQPEGQPTQAPAEEETMPYGLKPGKPYAGQTITVLITGIVPQYQAMMNSVPEFTELTGIEVKWDTVPWDSLVEKVTTDGVSQQGAFDVYPFMDSWGPAISQFLLPIDDYIKEAGIDWNDFPKAYRDGACYSDGNCYGIPLRGHPQLLFYRQDIFDELGLNPPTTFKELEEVSKVIQDKTDLYGFSICYGPGFGGQSLMTWVPFLWGNGSDIFDENWNPIFNNEAGVEASQRHVDLLLKHKIVPPAATTWGEAAMANSMRQGESAMMMSWWWLLPTFSDPELTSEEVLGKVAYALPPGWEGKQAVPYALSMPIGINKFSKHPDAAWEFIKMMTHPELDKKRVIDKSDPAAADIVAVHLSVLTDPEVNAVNGGIHLAAAESLKSAKIMPLIPEWLEITTVLETAIQQMATGAPVKETLDAAASDVHDIMDRAGYYK